MSNAFAYAERQDRAPLRARPAALVRSRTKRLMDLSCALILILFLSPLLLLIAAAVVATSRGPALFRQRRTGLNGKVFTIYKFRSMTVLEDGDEIRQASQADVRVTTVGRFLRKSSLDELPQLINVLKGDMSLVGPRPHAVAHDSQFALLIPHYWNRYRAKPGITGLSQVGGLRGEVGVDNAIELRVASDLEYIENWSLWLDMKILARTLPLIIRDARAY